LVREMYREVTDMETVEIPEDFSIRILVGT